MKLFVKTSHKVVVFLLLFPIWTDLILPNRYKSSELAFFIWCMLIGIWFHFAFLSLSKNSYKAINLKKYYYISLLYLLINLFTKWGLGIETYYVGDINIRFLNLICYIFLVHVVSKILIQLESGYDSNWEYMKTFIQVFFIPIGAWWIHKRIQQVGSDNKVI